MNEGLYRVEQTVSFTQCLQQIDGFLSEVDASQAFERLVSDLETTVVSNLERFPRIGRRFREAPLQSAESLAALAALPLGGAESLREYLHGDYLILYIDAPADRVVHLLSIRHHRQLSFNFAALTRR